MRLADLGLNDPTIARRLGLPRTTVRDIRAPRPKVGGSGHRCPHCGEPARRTELPAVDYCELLGLYLGDGHISSGARTDRLRISLDTNIPGFS